MGGDRPGALGTGWHMGPRGYQLRPLGYRPAGVLPADCLLGYSRLHPDRWAPPRPRHDHGHEHAHPESATATLAGITSLFTAPEWRIDASYETSRMVCSRQMQLHDVVVRAHRIG